MEGALRPAFCVAQRSNATVVAVRVAEDSETAIDFPVTSRRTGQHSDRPAAIVPSADRDRVDASRRSNDEPSEVERVRGARGSSRRCRRTLSALDQIDAHPFNEWVGLVPGG